jgi:hypothetical protein
MATTIQREVKTTREKRGVASLQEIAGIAEDHGPLIDGIPVSEAPELYLIGPASRRLRDRRWGRHGS